MDNVFQKTENYFDMAASSRVGSLEQVTEKALNHIGDKVDRIDTFSKSYRDLWQKMMGK